MAMERGIITITENGAVAMPTAPVWMTQQEMSDAFNVFGCDIRKAIHFIYKNMELREFGIILKQNQLFCMFNGISLQCFGLIVIKAICCQRCNQIH